MKIVEYGKRIGFTFLGIFTGLILLTLGYYFNIIGSDFFRIVSFLMVLIFIFSNSFILGHRSLKKGYLEGIKYASIICLFIFIISLITKSFNLFILIYYLIIFITAILGSMIGISKKKS